MPGTKRYPVCLHVERNYKIDNCEHIKDAYEELLKACNEKKIIIRKYEESNSKILKWIETTIKNKYENSENNSAYGFFLKTKFPFLKYNLKNFDFTIDLNIYL